jgi:hypothetical protein
MACSFLVLVTHMLLEDETSNDAEETKQVRIF